ncbi:activator of 90 kDa heat shock protein ATPase homolog 1-like [Rhopilema esculentum]|uniref:activator of 90 kDa heat shock protein ATPase homolog 1-like n=1 Tax=Rhopilema esculentum TaxID=499914 RepID=UPI0031D84F46
MAKWGEGDPRWIVEERPDSTNVNNWHWSEKNATNWSKERISELLKRMNVKNDTGEWKVKEITKIEGEASANNRKAKLIFFYEFVIKIEWKGSLKDEFTNHQGYFEVSNLSEENDPDDLDIIVTIKEGADGYSKMKEFVRKTGIPLMREKLAQYIKELKEEYSKGLILPTKKTGASPQPAQKTDKTTKVDLSEPLKAMKTTPKKEDNTVKVQLKLKEEFKTTSSELFQVLTDENRVSAFTREKATVDAKPGGKFSILGGNISGEFVELIPDRKIVQKWKFGSWPEGCFSTVTMDLIQKEDCTVLELTQIGIPDYDFDKTETGWKRYFWESIKQTFGYGARLF